MHLVNKIAVPVSWVCAKSVSSPSQRNHVSGDAYRYIDDLQFPYHKRRRAEEILENRAFHNKEPLHFEFQDYEGDFRTYVLHY